MAAAAAEETRRARVKRYIVEICYVDKNGGESADSIA